MRLANALAGGLRSVTVLGVVAVAALAWIALRQRNAVVLALLAPMVTLAAERLLKPLVGRRAPGSTVFHYPSGHVAVATAVALCLVLIVRSVRARPATRTVTVVSAGLLALLMALARLVETAHVLSDVVGGAATGVAVTLAVALLLDGRPLPGGGRSGRPAGLGARRSGDLGGRVTSALVIGWSLPTARVRRAPAARPMGRTSSRRASSTLSISP